MGNLGRFHPRRDKRGGASFIGILLVVVILLVLAGYYFGGGEGSTPGVGDYMKQSQKDVGTYQISKGRAQRVVDGENLRTLQLSINMWMSKHPGERPTIEALRADPSISVPEAPAGCRYEINEKNEPVLVEVEPVHIRGVPLSPSGP